MRDVLFLAWRYLRFNRGKAAVLVGSISLILFLPAGLQVVVEQGARALTARADATPLLVGSPGSAVDLTLAALYFREPSLEPTAFREVERVSATGLATAIPLHLRFQVREQRIVGTTLDYLDFRGLAPASGRSFAALGECALGAAAARALEAGVGDHVLSTPAGAFDVAGSFPLKMTVVGVLAPTGTADDEAVFVDLKTAWVISGLAHGHVDVTVPDAAGGVLSRDEDNVVANASVLSYTEITPDNIDSFHFHGDPAGFPVDAVLAVPRDRKSGVVLRGRYAEPSGSVQMVVPRKVVDDLVETMFSVRNAVMAVSLGLGLATIATAALVFALSVRLRRREIETMRKIGAPRGRVRAVLACEVLLVVVASVAIAGALTALVSRFGGIALRLLGA
jgi:putative ABC transport system permease protein